MNDLERTEPQFIREIPSETRAKGFHVKWRNQHYYVSVADHGRFGTFCSAYEATNRGRPNFQKTIFCIRGNDSERALEYLLNVLHGTEEAKIEKVY